MVQCALAICAYPAGAERIQELDAAEELIRRVGYTDPQAVDIFAGFALEFDRSGSVKIARDLLTWILAAYEVDALVTTRLELYLARIQRTLGAWPEVELLLSSADEKLRAVEDPQSPDAQNLILILRSRHALEVSNGWLDLGVLDLGLEWLMRAQESAEQITEIDSGARNRKSHERASILLALGDYFLMSGQFERIESTLTPLLESPNHEALATLYVGIAEGGLERVDAQRVPRARGLLERSIQLGLPPAEARKAHLGLADLALRRAEAAAEVVTAAIAAAVANPLSTTALQAVAQAAYEARRSGQEAREQLTQVLDMMSPGASAGTAGTTFGVGLPAAYWGRLTMLPWTTKDERRQAYSQLGSAVDQAFEEWSQTPRRPGGLGFLQLTFRRMTIRVYCALSLLIEGPVEGSKTAVNTLLRSQSMGSLLAELGGALDIDLEVIQDELLAEDSGALVFLPGKYGSLLAAIDRGGISFHELPNEEILKAVSLNLRNLLVKPFRAELIGNKLERAESLRFNEVNRASIEAARVLLPPAVRDRLAAWKHVTIVGSEFLHNIPFECLRWRESKLLGLTHSVDSLPSLPLQLALRRRARAEAANFSGTLMLVNLPEIRSVSRAATPEELKRVFDLMRPFANDNDVLLSGAEANLDSLADRAAGELRPALLHFFAHGGYDSSLERGTQLLLAGVEPEALQPLNAETIEREGIAGRCVVLSACGAARGLERLGDDTLAHLGGAYLRAGAECVVLSRAELDLEQTTLLMKFFHESLAAGNSPSEAMRQARYEYVEARPGRWAEYSACRLQVFGHGSASLFGRK